MGSASPLLGRVALLVVGAGPVGVAALWYAHRYGVDAVAVDAADRPFRAVHDFAPGLVTASGALDWEIDGLPVDCQKGDQVTREDLLGYYTRVCAYGRLRVACAQRVVGVSPRARNVRVDVTTNHGPGHWQADRVLVTSWYRRRRLDVEGVVVRDTVGSDAALFGEQVVIVGAGLSGLEATDLLTRRGHRVTLLAREERPTPGEVTRLLALSRSTFIPGVERLRASRPGFLEIVHAGRTSEVPCTVALNCTGQQVDGGVLRVLRAGRLLDDATVAQLEACRRSTVFDRTDPAKLAASLPNLSDAIWQGRRRVHFAGAIHHVGGARASGIPYSIETAHWAVASIAGRRLRGVPPASEHVASWFVRHAQERRRLQRGPRWSRHLAAIVPLPVPSWSRGTRLCEWETALGKEWAAASRVSHALPDARTASLTALREACYAGVPVRALLDRGGLSREGLVGALRTLWYNNGLTWVPPAGR